MTFEQRQRAILPVDYLDTLQTMARRRWHSVYGRCQPTRDRSVREFLDTPLGVLSCRTWRENAAGKLRFRSEYWLDDEPITISEFRGLTT